MSDREKRISIQECARRLGVHEKTVRRYVKRGLLRTFTTPAISKYGQRHRILETDLERFIARHLVGPTRIEAPRILGGEKVGNGPDRGAKNSDASSAPENLY